MAQQFSGFVAKLGVKTGNGSRGAWTLYSIKLEKEDGSEHPWISLGFRDTPPPIKEGDYVTLQASENDRGQLQAVEGSASKPKNPPARASKANSGGAGKPGGGFKGGNRGGYQPRVRDGSGVNDRTNPEDAKRMSYANARTSAIDLVVALLASKALPISAATGKAGEAKRFDEILATVDKLTVQFYHDGMTLRKLVTVADAGAVSTGSDGDLPPSDDGKGHDIDKDIPPPDSQDQGGDSGDDNGGDEERF